MMEVLDVMEVTVNETLDQAAEFVARRLTDLQNDKDKAVDQKNWEMATFYVEEFGRLADLYRQEYGKYPKAASEVARVNSKIRQHAWYQGPRTSFLSHAKKLAEVFPVSFGSGTKGTVPYEHIRQIAVCSLPLSQKQEMLTWVEDEEPTREQMRMEIRRLVDAQSGVIRPDFELKISNHWKFSGANTHSGFDGGIHIELVANLLYYFTDAGDVVIDPMAGGDTTYRAVQSYSFFTDRYSGDFGGPRDVYRADIDPRTPGIEQADVRQSLPWPDAFADFCVLDPPYYGIAEGKYASFGKTMEEWKANLTAAVSQISRVLKVGGCVAVVVDDYLRAKEFQPSAAIVFEVLSSLGLTPAMTIYNSYPNAVVTMGAVQMWRAKRARLPVSEMKIIHVFEKSS